ncbi:NADH-ubiquinone oxidoreductase 21.3 kDa subunit [Xylaria bambusicola]|uniref:NADH-ubiquinone oxidoreductase 21.3 kDa subunit n=1 Tax=Xylaria bambusicola TaxID=326684 RepID=UPI002007E83D|nr:NADH-ubiquinone oxidoreductase 21.3 kDa subunit [Xylaria bambusicola]KAI0514581.1 NADH-ubiquinone oxidoreductase 21.3 kDa subunit [Xylaria bambusicola]
MASKAVAKVAKGVVPLSQKQTLESTGFWDRVRRVFAVDPNRSSGVPLNPYFRNPTPGALDPLIYDDPVTLPAGDIADNPYWKRDGRRSYPKLSVVNQADAVALLSVGSAAAPKRELIGDAGAKQLVAVAEEGQSGGLAAYFEKNTTAVAAEDLLVNGLPPLPSGERKKTDGKWEAYKYGLTEENSYPEDYPCRTFQ